MDPMNMGVWLFFFFCFLVIQFCFFFCLTRLDSNVFDAKSYYEQLIMTSSLPTLLKREHDLITGTYFFKKFYLGD